MNIVVTLYYIDFARYFLYLRDAILEVDDTIQFTFVCFYPSAHDYLRSRQIDSLFLPDLLKQASSSSGNYESLISYQQQLMPELETGLLLDEVARCVAVFDGLLNSVETSLLISSGDTRMQSEAAITVAKTKQIPVLYFEQGAFGTTIFDGKGVNANVSFRGHIGSEAVEKVDLQQIERFRQGAGSYSADYSIRDRFFEKLDLLWLYPLPGFSNRIPYYCQTGESFLDFVTTRIRLKRTRSTPTPLPQRYIFLPLQMPIDAQVLYHSPLYRDFSDVIRDVAAAMPQGYALVVREHPNYAGRYERSVYEAIEESGSIVLINDSNLQETLLNCDVVAVINSAVGLEAISYHKKVLLMGDAYYECDSGLTKLKNRRELPDVLRRLLAAPVDGAAVDQYLHHLIHQHLLPGHFRDQELSGGPVIAKKILEHIRSEGSQV